MATAHRYKDRSQYYLACFTGLDGKRFQLPTKCRIRNSALTVALAMEGAARSAREGALSQARAKLVVDGLAPLDTKLQERIRRILNEWLTLCDSDPLSEHTVREWSQFWLENSRVALAPGTHQRYTGVLAEFLGRLGPKADQSLNQLSVKSIKDFRDQLLRDGISGKTANFVVKILRAWLRAAKEQGYITFNRAEAVKLVESGSAGSAGSEAIEKEPFTREDMDGLLRAATSREWRELIAFAYYTGGRLGDLAQLCFENLDLVAGTLTLVPRKQRRSHKPKSLTIPVHPGLLELVMAHEQGSGPIFPTLRQRKVSGKYGLSLAFGEIMDRAGIAYKTKTRDGGRGRTIYSKGFHSLRHTTNSILANLGVPQEQRLEIMGQASLEVNDGYTTFDRDTKRRAISQLPRLPLEVPDSRHLKVAEVVDSTISGAAS